MVEGQDLSKQLSFGLHTSAVMCAHVHIHSHASNVSVDWPSGAAACKCKCRLVQEHPKLVSRPPCKFDFCHLSLRPSSL